MVPVAQSRAPLRQRCGWKAAKPPSRATLFLLTCKRLNCLGKVIAAASASGAPCDEVICPQLGPLRCLLTNAK